MEQVVLEKKKLNHKKKKFINNAPQLIYDQNPLEISANNDQWQHVRKGPTWLSVYEITRIKQSDDLFSYFTVFSYYDPWLLKMH